MRSVRVGAAAFLALGLGIASYIMLIVEPRMGFATPADFFDPVKIVAANGSSAWLVGNFVYLMIPVAIVTFIRSTNDRDVIWSGMIAALLFLILAAIGLVGKQLPSLLSSQEEVVDAVAAALPIRFALLKTTVVVFGVFAWATTRLSPGTGPVGGAWRAFGWVTLLASVTFLFVFLPMPLLFFVWAVALTVQQLRSSSPTAASAES